jgi:hypothetical protein
MKPEDLIHRIKQHGMLKEGIDEQLLEMLVVQFSNSTIGNMDISAITKPFMDEINRIKH